MRRPPRIWLRLLRSAGQIGVKDTHLCPEWRMFCNEVVVSLCCLVEIVRRVRVKDNFQSHIKIAVIDMAVVVRAGADRKRDCARMSGEVHAAARHERSHGCRGAIFE